MFSPSLACHHQPSRSCPALPHKCTSLFLWLGFNATPTMTLPLQISNLLQEKEVIVVVDNPRCHSPPSESRHVRTCRVPRSRSTLVSTTTGHPRSAVKRQTSYPSNRWGPADAPSLKSLADCASQLKMPSRQLSPVKSMKPRLTTSEHSLLRTSILGVDKRETGKSTATMITELLNSLDLDD